MSTFMNSVQKLVARHTTRSLAAAAGLAAMIATSGHAAPVEYVKVCSLYGAGFFYIPGTDTCVDARQIAHLGCAHAGILDKQHAVAIGREPGHDLLVSLPDEVPVDGRDAENVGMSVHRV